jgi:hypothetical protein
MQNPVAEQVVKSLKEANNVLVTVKNSPSVDELSAAIALTLLLNALGKHATTVFSGRVPSTLEFLQPEMAIDTNTDSLRDFIIALDKSKADKLRYKVEDNVVRIFITPYRASISERDLDFSQGEFNVDVVIALGVVEKEDFDQAVTEHGRILHDATVITLTKQDMTSQIGAVNWHEPSASSICEMIAGITDELSREALDGQMATALLTGIVAETDRFKNSKTSPQVLSISSKLMVAGANQQLIAEKLEEEDMGPLVAPIRNMDGSENADGTLEINHEDDDQVQNIHIDDSGNLLAPDQASSNDSGTHRSAIVESGQETQEAVESSDAVTRSYIETPGSALIGTDDTGAEQSESSQPLFTEEAESQTSEVQDYTPPPSQVVSRQVLQPLSEDVSNSEPVMNQESSSTEQQPSTAAAANIQTVDQFLGTSASSTNEQPQQQEATQQQPDILAQEPVATPAVQPAPQVIDPTVPPSVPPPLLPQAPAVPQFFDADGNSQNPYLNPN